MKLKTDFELVNMTITGDLNTFWWGDEAEIWLHPGGRVSRKVESGECGFAGFENGEEDRRQ